MKTRKDNGMRRVIFSFRGAGIQSKVTETVEVDPSATDEEIDEQLSQWLWETSDANWKDADG